MDCKNCEAMAAEIAKLEAEIAKLEIRIAWLESMIAAAKEIVAPRLVFCGTIVQRAGKVLGQKSGVPRASWAHSKAEKFVAENCRIAFAAIAKALSQTEVSL